MKNWQETVTVMRRIRELGASGQACGLATVIQIDGSAYRRPGAKLLIEASGDMLGGVSGGCLEADVREHGLVAVRDNQPRLLHYDTGEDEHRVWGLGLGCDGSVDVFVQPITPLSELLQTIERLLEGDQAFAISTVVGDDPQVGAGAMIVVSEAGVATDLGINVSSINDLTRASRDHLSAGTSALHEVGPLRVFTEILNPPPRLIIFGAGDDAMPLERAATTVGFRVAVVDHRPAYVEQARFPNATQLVSARSDDDWTGPPLGPDAYCVVMTHSLNHDREWVRRLAATTVPYIGVLGPRARTEKIIDEIGLDEPDRVFGPVGLDLGADGPEQVAVSILSELLAARSSRTPRHLRTRQDAIHVT